MRFLRDDRGIVALLFAVLAIPVIGLMGAGIDYNRAMAARTSLQASLDAASLMLAALPRSTPTEELRLRAQEYIAANYSHQLDFPVEIDSVTREQGRVSLSASTAVPTTMMALLGFDRMDIASASEATLTIGRIEVALVLDNSYSMGQQGRMTELRRASRALLDFLEDSAHEPGLVKVSIIPFDAHVRVGTENRNASWLRHQSIIHQWLWQGCLEDRDQPYDVTNAAPVNAATRHPGASCESGSLATMLPLTENFHTMRQRIDAMQPNGVTNITIGVAWGHAALSPGLPLTGAAEFGTEDLTKIMLVMTDGDNTANRWIRNLQGDVRIDDRTRLACEAARDAEIAVYTVRFMQGNENLMRDCASNPSMYYNVTSVDQLLPAFEDIGRQITKLRLSR